MPAPRDNIRRLHAYTPGEQPTWADTARPLRPVVKLNTNENPYPPCDAVLRAIRELPAEALRLYPPPTADRFRAAAGAMLGLNADHVIATNGGDELLRLLITAYCKPKPEPERSEDPDQTPTPPGGTSGIGVTDPTYSLYPVLADIHETPVTKVARDPGDFAPPPAAELAQRWNDAGCALAFLVNPHAPSGRLENLTYLTTLADAFRGLLVIDEAYVDFAESDALPLIASGRDDVVLLRSLSKGYSLAGLRFGFGVAHPSVVATLDKARDSYNTDILSQVAATAAVRHRAEAATTWAHVIAERKRLAAALRQRGFAVLDSQTNFLLATPPPDPGSEPAPGSKPIPGSKPVPGSGSGQGAADIYRALKQRDILIRYFETPPLSDRLRITVGTPEQNTQLLEALDAIRAATAGGSGASGAPAR